MKWCQETVDAGVRLCIEYKTKLVISYIGVRKVKLLNLSEVKGNVQAPISAS